MSHTIRLVPHPEPPHHIPILKCSNQVHHVHTQRRARSPTPIIVSSRTQPAPPGYRDTLRHAASFLLRELNGPRPTRASQPWSLSSPVFPPSGSSSQTGSFFGSGIAVILAAAQEIWDECDLRFRALARSERVWARVSRVGQYGGSVSNLAGASHSNMSMNNLNSVNGISAFSAAGEERERILFAEAVRDGYVRCFIIFSFISTISDA